MAGLQSSDLGDNCAGNVDVSNEPTVSGGIEFVVPENKDLAVVATVAGPADSAGTKESAGLASLGNLDSPRDGQRQEIIDLGPFMEMKKVLDEVSNNPEQAVSITENTKITPEQKKRLLNETINDIIAAMVDFNDALNKGPTVGVNGPFIETVDGVVIKTEILHDDKDGLYRIQRNKSVPGTHTEGGADLMILEIKRDNKHLTYFRTSFPGFPFPEEQTEVIVTCDLPDGDSQSGLGVGVGTGPRYRYFTLTASNFGKPEKRIEIKSHKK
jgi:hypothetical protein